ncbi:hypothetical protein FDP41_004046 [Naegleria fowleri]|uniref:asparaginase n=1 Tax=Naegleria fowleri TaxID=5763 RepID=A0A6A5BR62_NAEFO|nr:uncharacterized protein FDP41_004046 [Naegleria fowleri]KAF0976751.1 hypothetical protein FDP41_004046 [Naegleria fowleri]
MQPQQHTGRDSDLEAAASTSDALNASSERIQQQPLLMMQEHTPLLHLDKIQHFHQQEQHESNDDDMNHNNYDQQQPTTNSNNTNNNNNNNHHHSSEIPKGPKLSPRFKRKIFIKEDSHKPLVSSSSLISIPVVPVVDLPSAALSITKILAIYTGGTIGMKKFSDGYHPVRGYLRKKLAQLSQFNDARHRKLYLKMAGVINDQDTEETERAKMDQWFSTPRSDDGCVALYQLLEFDPILDSSNMGYKDWVKIAQCISDHYDDYDCFIVLHGTDTMCYTASALSFMFRHLAKTVILTGSQIPISQTRNDGFDNLLGAITIASKLYIPEVCVFFHNKLFRGNRCTKMDAGDLSAFDSPNIAPLVKLGIDMEVNWALIRPPPGQNQEFRMIPISNSNVGMLRIFPGISTSLMSNFFLPPTEGVVMLSYGVGNVPSTRSDFLKCIKEATERGVVIVNCTQCFKGAVSASYKTGSVLYELGVVSGSDMTPEAAVTKLMYLISCDMDLEEVKRLLTVDLRGELTKVVPVSKYSLRERGFVSAVCKALNFHGGESDMKEVSDALLPVIMCNLGAIGAVDEMRRLLEVEGVDPNIQDYDKRTALHLAAVEGQLNMVQLLVEYGADINCKDR